MVDEVRRRRCAPVVTWVEEGEARLMNSQREEKPASSLDQGLRCCERIACTSTLKVG